MGNWRHLLIVLLYDKEEFLISVNKQMSYYGLQTFFDMHTDDRTMKSLILNSRLFDLDDIIKEYESLLIKLNPVLEDNNC